VFVRFVRMVVPQSIGEMYKAGTVPHPHEGNNPLIGGIENGEPKQTRGLNRKARGHLTGILISIKVNNQCSNGQA
jgi:hypothetical protein